jgi:Predicted ATPase (AAA+ superfamily)
MEKRIIKGLIAEKQKEILETTLIQRDIILEDGVNYVFTGLRRAGKSYLLYQHIQGLIASGKAKIENILYVNFEDERMAPMKAEELNILLECYQEMYEGKPLIFLDEIQNVDGWEKFVRRLADSKYRVFVTGSNAKMLSREIYTTLGGRFIAKEVFPFSLLEYLRFHHIFLEKNWEYGPFRTQVAKLFPDYFYYGGFAESFPLKDKRSWLNALYQKIFLGDIIVRNNIRNDKAVGVLVRKLAESLMQPTSLARIKNIIDASGVGIARNTLVDFLRQLSDAFLIFDISNFSDSLSERETFKKRYFYDNGLLNNLLFDPETKLLENMVAIDLKKRYGEGLYYYNRNIEVDFFIPKAKRAIQVSYSIADEKARQREIRALIKLAGVHPLERLEIVSWDEEMLFKEGGNEIHVIPVWKWLLYRAP